MKHLYLTLEPFILLSGFLPLVFLWFKKKVFAFQEAIVPFVWLTAFATLYEAIGTAILKIGLPR